MYQATEDNKWEILEYFAENKPYVFFGLIKYYSTKKRSVKNVTFSHEEIIERYGNADLDTLPEVLRNHVKICLDEAETDMNKKEDQKQRGQFASEGKDKWYDEYGELKRFFQMGKFTIYSKEEYVKVAYKLIGENMTMGMFCWKYGIDNVKGFEEMLNLIAEEDANFAKLWKEQKLTRQKEYIANVKRFIEGVAFKKLSVGEMIENTIVHFERLVEFAERYYDNKIVDAFIENVVKYYYDRLNFTSEDNVEKINNMLTKKEIKFLVGSEDYAEIVRRNKKVNLSSTFNKSIEPYLTRNQSGYVVGLVHGKGQDKINRRFERDYGSVFDKDKYNTTENFLLHNGKQIPVTNEILEQSFHYIKTHELYPSDTTMRMVIRAVACGEIENQYETTITTKQQMRDRALMLCEFVYNLDEYFKIIDENTLQN